MARMAKRIVWAEMARRKVQFHAKERWQDIRLWGLFNWGSISHMLASGELVTGMRKENRTIWVVPSAEAYEKHIKPLIENHTLDELMEMAGWGTRSTRHRLATWEV